MGEPYWVAEVQNSLHLLAQNLHERQFKGNTYDRLPSFNNSCQDYTLTPYYKLKLANNLAFLACTEEGGDKVSAVCLEKHRDQLTIRLASNKCPEIHREAFMEEAFATVMNLCGTRILQRTRPCWAKKPHRLEKKASPLQSLDNDWALLTKTLQRRFATTLHALEKMREHLRCLDTMNHDSKDLRETLRNNVLAAYDASAAETPRTLEEKLRRCGPAGLDLAGRAAVRQVDKLGRYYGVCKDFAKLARHQSYQRLFSSVIVARCDVMPKTCRDPAGGRKLHVHAEVQLVMHYLSRNLSPAPRAISCSKSACFLCHALISRLGHWSLSACHGKLYSKWKVPDGVHLTHSRAKDLARALRQVRDELKTLGAGAKVQVAESPALSLISGPSTATLLSIASGSRSSSAETIGPNSTAKTTATAYVDASTVKAPTGRTASAEEVLAKAKSNTYPDVGISTSHETCNNGGLVAGIGITNSPAATLQVKENDLPYEVVIFNYTLPLLDLQLGHLSLHLDLIDMSVGRIKISRYVGGDELDILSLEATDLPFAEPGRKLSCERGSNVLRFNLLCFECAATQVEITWRTT
ncbi:uncharacterized protein PpBr36_10993 [Pyricularia pennisetigena]|uniref:uncharacterized protein n=1 Tax=Pyricularia pennisetigena TaxID=1578925 RepID=UPI001151E61E|nr:uncharacterized protein PpBr36_10993 [Pyricularia pennisetigena]TLS20811.1 hypothetical protein PpBr36_10993 [Pyricularia pennisetigena]